MQTDEPKWYLEGFTDEQKVLQRIPITSIPFRVGRLSTLPLPLNFINISRTHAEFYEEADKLMLRDLGSRNGTFLNRERLEAPAAVAPGDVVHFGTCEFRLLQEDAGLNDPFMDTLSFEAQLPRDLETGMRELLDMINTQAVQPVFQPLVRLADRTIFSYEALGRGTLDNFFTLPKDLFRVAGQLRLEDELSRIFRAASLEAVGRMPKPHALFLNVHPAEMQTVSRLLKALEGLRSEYPTVDLTMEVHESLVTDVASIQAFRAELKELGIRVAYDDFGAGQARLVELVEVPPDYLKFDISLVQGIHKAPQQRQQMVEMLIKFARDVGVETLAEGIEVPEEAEACRQLGFDSGQGYYFGRPKTVESYQVDSPTLPTPPPVSE
ncbi:MAG: EAL domain-containing protein [Candidatus Sumerlaeaceae bacterium]|nr:EAL domain-containing protein [Candidatus Sumerlaeaceae bacterium]